MNKIPQEIKDMPNALYPCKNEYCAEEHTFPPEDLFYIDSIEAHG